MSDAKRTQYLWHLMVPVNAAVDLEPEEVAEHLHKLASSCVEDLIIDTHTRENVVACEQMTASTLEPVGEDGGKEA